MENLVSLPNRMRAAVERVVLVRLLEGNRTAQVTLTTDHGTQFTSWRFIETLNRLIVTHLGTAYHYPEGSSHIERLLHRLREEEVWTAECRKTQKARESICHWIEEYVHGRPHHGVGNRTAYEAFLGSGTLLKTGH